MTKKIKQSLITAATVLLGGLLVLAFSDTGHSRNVRGGAKVNVHHKANVSHGASRSIHSSAKKVSKNVKVNRPAYRPGHVDIDVRHGYPVARGVAAGTAAVATAAAVGSMVYSLPSGCHHEKVNGVWYYRCGNTWYEQRYSGSQMGYVPVSSPR